MNKNKNLLQYYPIAVRLKDKNALVVGGGVVAERKVGLLSGTGVRIRVVSPKATKRLRQLAKSGRIRWIPRNVKRPDMKNVHIIIAATNDSHINKMVNSWAKSCRALVNVVDNKKLSDFISPAVFKSGEAIAAVYTDGRDPALSRDMKNFLKENWNEFLAYRNRLQKNTR